MRVEFYPVLADGRPGKRLGVREWQVVPRVGEAVMLLLDGGREHHGTVLSVQWGDQKRGDQPLALVALEAKP